MVRDRRSTALRFAVTFVVLETALTALIIFLTPHIGPALVNAQARNIAWMLRRVGLMAVASSGVIVLPRMTLVISLECTGAFGYATFLAAVLAYPGTLRRKARGVVLGLGAMALFNELRLLSLGVLGAYRPNLVSDVHVYLWQTTLVFLCVALWIVWAVGEKPRSISVDQPAAPVT